MSSSLFNFKIWKNGNHYTIYFRGQIIEKDFANVEEAYQWSKTKLLEKYPLEIQFLARLFYETYSGV